MKTFVRLLGLAALPFFVVSAAAHPEPKEGVTPVPDIDFDIAKIERLAQRLEGLAGMMERELGESVTSDKLAGGKTRHKMIKDPDALRGAARELEKALDDADLFETLADVMITLADTIEVVEGDGGLALSIDGTEMASIETDETDRVTLRAGGKKVTIQVD